MCGWLYTNPLSVRVVADGRYHNKLVGGFGTSRKIQFWTRSGSPALSLFVVFAKKHVFEMTQRHTLASFLDKRVIITELFRRRNCGKLAFLQGKNTTEIRSPSSISACKVAVQMNFRIFECLCNKTSNLYPEKVMIRLLFR